MVRESALKTLKDQSQIYLCVGRYLELSLPKFSLTAVTDLRSVLSEMAVEKYLMGSDANFRRLSSKKNFTVDEVKFCLVFASVRTSKI